MSKKKSKRGAGLMKEMKASKELQAIVKEKKISRGQMMKAVWKYIRKHNLQSKKDKRIIKPDEKLGVVIGEERLNMFDMTKKLSEHLS
jgi:DNA topoisomerase-1